MFNKIKNIFKKRETDISLRIAGISYSKVGNIYVLILEEEILNWSDSKNPPPNARKIPILITFLEAQIIAVELEKIKPQIILIYDVFKEIANAYKLKFKKIIISDFTENEVFSKIICSNRKKTKIDIKPSDAVALSMRLKIPIYINDKMLTDIHNMLIEKYDVKRMSEMEKLENYSLQDLKKILQDAIDKEDYENASLIRDEIFRKNSV